MTRLWGTVLAAAIVSASVPHAVAQPAPPANAEEEAKTKFLAGKQSYRLGEYDEAIALWKEAYRLKDNPAFLFNIGQAYREKGDLPKALQFFESYLKEAPANASNRKDVEQRVVELKKLIEDQRASAKRPPNEPVELNPTTTTNPTGTDPTTTASTDPTTTSPPIGSEPEDPMEGGGGGGGGMRIAGLATGGVGLALIGTGVIFGLKAKSAQSDVEDAIANGEVWTEELEQKDADGRSAATTSSITLGIGAAAVVGGGVLFYLGLRKGKTESEGVSLVPQVGADHAGVTFLGRF